MLKTEPETIPPPQLPSDKVPPPAVDRPQPMVSQRPSLLRNELLWAALGSLALAAVFGRVALLNLTQGAVGGHIDGYNNIWNYWWLKTALLDLHQDPFYTNYIYYPTGTSLRFHTFNPFNGLVTLPFNLAFGYVPSFNLLFVAAPFLTSIFSFLLIRDIVGNPWAAFVGAAIATYSDYHVAVFLATGQSSYITMQFIPLYFFFLFRTLHGTPLLNAQSSPDPSIRIPHSAFRIGLYAAATVITLIALTLTDWQYVMLVVFATLLYFAFVLVTRREWREKMSVFATLSAIGGSYAAIVAFPLLLPMVDEAARSPWLDVSYQAVQHSVDIGWLSHPGIGLAGVLIVGLALLGLWTAVRRGATFRETAAFWALAVAVFYAMSLGPVLLVNGQTTRVPMPYSLLQDVPVLSSGRDPARFTLIATLGMGVLVAFGVRALLGWLSRVTTGSWPTANSDRRPMTDGSRTAVAPIVTVVVIVGTLSGVMMESGKAQASPPDWPDFYRQLATDRESYAILELPLFSDEGRGADHYQVYQVLHHKPRFSGRLARDRKLDNPNNFVKRSSLFRHLWMINFPESQLALFRPERDILVRTDYATHGIPILNYYNVRYIVLYKEALTPETEGRMEEVIREVLGESTTPHYEDSIMRVYMVPDAPPPADPLTLDIGEGWSASEVGPDGVLYRWADNTIIEAKSGYVITPTAQIYTMNLSQELVTATLSFAAYPYKEARTLIVAVNGYEAAKIDLKLEEGLKRVSLEVALQPGNNLIEVTSPEAPLPTDNPQADARLLSFAVRELSLERKP